jgi:hypothetical protein
LAHRRGRKDLGGGASGRVDGTSAELVLQQAQRLGLGIDCRSRLGADLIRIVAWIGLVGQRGRPDRG